MPTLVLLGQITPQGKTLTLPFAPQVFVQAPSRPPFTLTIAVEGSMVRVTVDGSEVRDADFMEYYIPGLDLARMVVSIAALHQGLGLTVVLDRMLGTDGLLHPFSLQNPNIEGLFSAYDLSTNMAPVSELALNDARLRTALHDLAEALAHPNDIAINCARAVESIRHMIAQQGSSTNGAWEQLRTALNVDRAFLQLVMDHSTQPRHGNHVHLPAPLNQELASRACKVMNRYLEYRLRGEIPLTEPDFPLLTG